MTDERGWKRYQNKEEGFVRGAALTKRSVAKRKGNSGIFKAKLRCEENKVWYGRAYIIYTDGETTYTKYSEIIRYPQQQEQENNRYANAGDKIGGNRADDPENLCSWR